MDWDEDGWDGWINASLDDSDDEDEWKNWSERICSQTSQMYARDEETRIVLNTILTICQGERVDEESIIEMMKNFPDTCDMKTSTGTRLFPLFARKRLLQCFSYLCETKTPSRGVEKIIAQEGWLLGIRVFVLSRKESLFPHSANKRVAQEIRKLKEPCEGEILDLFREWYSGSLKHADDLQWIYIAFADTICGHIQELTKYPPVACLYTMFRNMGYQPTVNHFDSYLYLEMNNVLFLQKVEKDIDLTDREGIADVVKRHLVEGLGYGKYSTDMVRFLVCEFRLGNLDCIKLKGRDKGLTLLGKAIVGYRHQKDKFKDVAKVLIQEGGSGIQRVIKSLRGNHWFSLKQSLEYYQYDPHVYDFLTK